MAIYAIWNNKGGVGKSYLTFQIACEYAKQYPAKKFSLLIYVLKQIHHLCY
ncbi:hypothetical protein DIBJMFBN_01622 [Mannheimia haemolytica]